MLEMLLNTNAVIVAGAYVLRQTANTQNVSWTVPDGVTSICCVCVGNGTFGGGGLSWRNNISVTPGEVLTISFGGVVNNSSNSAYTRVTRGGTILCIAYAGGVFYDKYNITTNGGYGGKRANTVNDGGGSGGIGQNTTSGNKAGGGAGGYLGDGGNASTSPTASTAGVAGSGSGSGGRIVPPYSNVDVMFSGGNVGLLGVGATGASATNNGFSFGVNGSANGGLCGGGNYRGNPPAGYNGGIRIIWGEGYSFPSNAVINE